MDIHYFDSPLGTIKVRGDIAGVQGSFEECLPEQKYSTTPWFLVWNNYNNSLLNAMRLI